MSTAARSIVGISFLLTQLSAAPAETTLSGKDAVAADWTQDAPGVRHRITPADLPPPFATESASNSPREVSRPDGAHPQVPAGFPIEEFASGFKNPATS